MPGRNRPPLDAQVLQEHQESRTRTLQSLGEHIKARREYKKLSQEALTHKIQRMGIDIQRSTLAHYEAGNVEAPLINLIAIASALHTTVTDLLGEQSGQTEHAAWVTRLRILQATLPPPVRELFAQRLLDHAESLVAFTRDVYPDAPYDTDQKEAA